MMQFCCRTGLAAAFTLAMSFFASPAAYAQWTAQVSGPDVFGATKVVAVVANMSGDGLVVKCDSTGAITLGYLLPATEDELNQASSGETAPGVRLLLKVGQGQPLKFSPTLTDWNDKYVGFVVTGPTPDLVTVIHAISAASAAVGVSGGSGGNLSDSFGTIGSTDAMNKVLSDCKLGAVNAGGNSKSTP